MGRRPCTAQDLARLTGEGEETVETLLTELETNGVFSKTRTGLIYNRRMVADERRRKDGEKAQQEGTLPGSKRGRQATAKQQQNAPPPEVGEGVGAQPPPNPESRGHKPKARIISSDDAEFESRYHDVGRRALEASGLDNSASTANYGPVWGWLKDGADPDLDILPTIREVVARKQGDPPRSLTYFSRAIADAKKRREAGLPATNGAGNGPKLTLEEGRLKLFREDGTWLPGWGDPPPPEKPRDEGGGADPEDPLAIPDFLQREPGQAEAGGA